MCFNLCFNTILYLWNKFSIKDKKHRQILMLLKTSISYRILSCILKANLQYMKEIKKKHELAKKRKYNDLVVLFLGDQTIYFRCCNQLNSQRSWKLHVIFPYGCVLKHYKATEKGSLNGNKEKCEWKADGNQQQQGKMEGKKEWLTRQ